MRVLCSFCVGSSVADAGVDDDDDDDDADDDDVDDDDDDDDDEEGHFEYPFELTLEFFNNSGLMASFLT